MKILFGTVLSSWRHRLTAEFDAADGWLRQELAVLNRFTLLGVPVTKVVGEVCPGARAGPPSVDFSNGALRLNECQLRDHSTSWGHLAR
jgi:hypothetical protein